MNSLKKGEGFPYLDFEGGPGVSLLNFEGGPGVPLLNVRKIRGPLLNFEGGPKSRVPGSSSYFTPCLTFISLIHFLLLFVLVFNFSFFVFSHRLAISFQFEF